MRGPLYRGDGSADELPRSTVHPLEAQIVQYSMILYCTVLQVVEARGLSEAQVPLPKSLPSNYCTTISRLSGPGASAKNGLTR